MKVGLFVPLGNGNSNAALLRAVGREAEARGFESIWVAEHVVMFDEYASQYPYSGDGRFPGGGDTGLLEPLTALSFLAAVTDHVRLGTGICLVPQRNPIYTAKQVADVDNLSGGRVDFGVGVGWLKEEFDILGEVFEDRGKRMDDYLAAMKLLWTQDTAEYHGSNYDLAPVRLYPKPVQSPHPPIHVGGESGPALRRVAEHGDGWYTFNRLPQDLTEPLAMLDELLAERGRARSDIELTVCPYFNAVTPELVAEYEAVGVDRLVLLCVAFDEAAVPGTMDELATLLP